MKKIVVLLLALAGCRLNAEAVKACAEACKNSGGVKFVDGMSCTCLR